MEVSVKTWHFSFLLLTIARVTSEGSKLVERNPSSKKGRQRVPTAWRPPSQTSALFDWDLPTEDAPCRQGHIHMSPCAAKYLAEGPVVAWPISHLNFWFVLSLELPFSPCPLRSTLPLGSVSGVQIFYELLPYRKSKCRNVIEGFLQLCNRFLN